MIIFRQIINFISKPSKNRTLGFVFMIVLIITVFVTVNQLQQYAVLEQFANEPEKIKSVYSGYIDGKLYRPMQELTIAEATNSCLEMAAENNRQSIQCLWGTEDIYPSLKDMNTRAELVVLVNNEILKMGTVALQEALEICSHMSDLNPNLHIRCMWPDTVISEYRPQR